MKDKWDSVCKTLLHSTGHRHTGGCSSVPAPPSWSQLRLAAVRHVRQIHNEIPHSEFPYKKEKQTINKAKMSANTDGRHSAPWWEGIQQENQSLTLSSLQAGAVLFGTMQEPWGADKGLWCHKTICLSLSTRNPRVGEVSLKNPKSNPNAAWSLLVCRFQISCRPSCRQVCGEQDFWVGAHCWHQP